MLGEVDRERQREREFDVAKKKIIQTMQNIDITRGRQIKYVIIPQGLKSMKL